MRAAYWYQLNNAGEKTTPATGLRQLVDSVTDKEVFMGWGKLLPAYDSYYEFKDLAKYLVAHTGWGFPTELEVCGTYETGKPIRLAPKKVIRLRNECGVNSFVWDFMQSAEDPNIHDRIYEPSMALLQAFTQYRDYVDWEKLETTPGNFAFNPTGAGT
nr:hypothetical protein [Tanacetum cinerariifolium]